MANAAKIDIQGVQWELKDQNARDRIATLENLNKNYGNIGIDNAIVSCERIGNIVFFQGEKLFQMELNKEYKVAIIPNDLPATNERASSMIIDYESGLNVGIAYRPSNSNYISLYFTNRDTTKKRRYMFKLFSFQKNV